MNRDSTGKNPLRNPEFVDSTLPPREAALLSFLVELCGPCQSIPGLPNREPRNAPPAYLRSVNVSLHWPAAGTPEKWREKSGQAQPHGCYAMAALLWIGLACDLLRDFHQVTFRCFSSPFCG
jgi:hypothetical protein